MSPLTACSAWMHRTGWQACVAGLLTAGALLTGAVQPAAADNYRSGSSRGYYGSRGTLAPRYDRDDRYDDYEHHDYEHDDYIRDDYGRNDYGRHDYDRHDYDRRGGRSLPHGHGVSHDLDRSYGLDRSFGRDSYDEDSFSGGARSFDARHRSLEWGSQDRPARRRDVLDRNDPYQMLPVPGYQGGDDDRDWRDWNTPASPISPYQAAPSPQYPPQFQRQRPQAGMDQGQDLFQALQRRYQNPAVVQLLSELPADRGLALYAEILRLVDTRHINRPDLQSLVQLGARNLATAVGHPAFLQVNRMSAATPDQVQQFQQMLAQWTQQNPVRTVEDAVAVLSGSMQAAGQMLRLQPGAVAVEFIYGAMDGLDRFSAFVPPDAARTSSAQLNGVVGIGVQIEAVDRGAQVARVITGGPAATAGVQKGDVILAVNGRSLAGVSLDVATNLITGAEGTVVQVALQRAGQSPFQLALPRRTVSASSVSDVRMIDPAAGIAYVKLETFAKSSTQELEAALWSLHQQKMQGLVLDLRDNPGGLLTTAVEVSNLFLPNGTIVSTRGRTPADNSHEVATSANTWKIPLVLLINENSASASEILAAAIQENGRGTIIGRHSYGKGTVQTLFPLQSASAMLRLTTAKFYSPTDREMANAGVEPDVRVPASSRGVTEGDPASDPDLQAALQAFRSAPRAYPVSRR